jgi:hypothetical protein
MYFGVEARSETISFHLKLVSGLKVQPEKLRRTEVSRKPKGGISGNGALPLHDLINSSCRNVRVLRHAVLRHT